MQVFSKGGDVPHRLKNFSFARCPCVGQQQQQPSGWKLKAGTPSLSRLPSRTPAFHQPACWQLRCPPARVSHCCPERMRCRSAEDRGKLWIAVDTNTKRFKKISTCLKAAVCPYGRRTRCSPGAQQNQGWLAQL